MNEWIAELKFDAAGLLPVVVQDATTREVLMLGYMNEESLRRTLATGQAVFYSRSRRELWVKGETSGNRQYVRGIAYDCDADTLLLSVEQVGSACHTGNRSCFFRRIAVGNAAGGADGAVEGDIFPELYRVIQERKAHPAAGSYTAGLLSEKDRILKKIGEEAGEVIIAAKNGDPKEIIHEVADLWFHSLVLLGCQGIPPEQVYKELRRRRK